MDSPSPAPDPPLARPFSEFAETGLLWLVNTSVFHPRGYALAFHKDDAGDVVGWSLLGDGTERWAFAENWPTDQRSPDDAFLTVKELMP